LNGATTLLLGFFTSILLRLGSLSQQTRYTKGCLVFCIGLENKRLYVNRWGREKLGIPGCPGVKAWGNFSLLLSCGYDEGE